jgi:hypothetical protein
MNAIERADKAKAILNSPLFEESFEIVRQRLITLIENAPVAAVEQAEDARKCLKLLRAVRQHLETTINTGKLEAFNLAEAEKRKSNPLRGLFR